MTATESTINPNETDPNLDKKEVAEPAPAPPPEVPMTCFVRFFDSKNNGYLFRFQATKAQLNLLSLAVSNYNVRTKHGPDTLTTLYGDAGTVIEEHNRRARTVITLAKKTNPDIADADLPQPKMFPDPSSFSQEDREELIAAVFQTMQEWVKSDGLAYDVDTDDLIDYMTNDDRDATDTKPEDPPKPI